MFGSPFGVSATSGGTTADGILDQPTSVVAGDQVLYIDYVFHCKNASFGTLKAGDSITVDGTAYTVRTNEAGLDGLTREISLQKT
jgi:riboflavin synthase alpha subunit